MAFRIAQEYEYQGGDYWKWSVWIEASEEELDQIENVEYTLHPTFPDPVRVVADRSSKFKLETAGWGVFRLYALVRLAGGSEARLEHDLVLRKDRAEPEPPEPTAGEELSGSTGPRAKPDADAFFEGPMFGAIAFAGALDAAAEVGGIRRWGRVGGSSGGALVAAMLAVGYEPDEIRRVVQGVDFRRLVDWGIGGRLLRSGLRVFFGRGLARSDRLGAWIDELLTAKVGHSPTFADVRDPENPAEVGGAGFRLRLLATDVTGVRLMIMPDDLADYDDGDGRPLDPEAFSLAQAVRMSMSTAVLFEPTRLHRNGRPHYIVEGGVLSPFPVWLFDQPEPTRPTWGFLIGGIDETEVYRPIPRLFGTFRLLVAMVTGVVSTRDREKMARSDAVRTIVIPTIRGNIRLGLSQQQEADLYEHGRTAGTEFFGVQREYLNSYGIGSEAVVAPSSAVSFRS
jgi:NTE family protein